MDAEFSALRHWAAVCPVAVVSTAGFYIAVVVAVAVPAVRRWTGAVFVTPPPATQVYTAALDSYRGLAALTVAVAHTVFWTYPVFWESKDVLPYLISYGGNKAVPVFVLLSGFLVYRSARKIDSADDLRTYARRRFLRIYPLYFVATVALFAAGQQTCKLRTVLPEVFMLRTVWFPQYANPVTWSLYMEVCFYAALPVFVALTGRWGGRAAAGGFVALAVSDGAGGRELWVWKYFLLGIVASHVADALGRLARWPAARELAGLLLAVAGVYALYHDLGGPKADWVSDHTGVKHNIAEYSIGLGLGFGLLVVGTTASRAVSGLFGVYPLRFLGTISYSVFLLHPFYLLANFPGLVLSQGGVIQPYFAAFGQAPWWFAFVAFVPGMLLWAAASYVLIERPFLRLRRAAPAPAGSVVLPLRRAA